MRRDLLCIPAVVAAFSVTGAQSQTPAQSASPAKPKFEVTSVKSCKLVEMSRGGRASGGGSSDPGRLSLACLPLKLLIESAYLRYANGVGHSPEEIRLTPIEGGPAWIDSERYIIDAKPESPQSQEMMRGPMMQALLEDRFQLKIHRETREVPVYELTVAKGGPMLQRSQVGSCIPSDWTKASPPPRAPDETRRPCMTMVTVNEGIATLEAQHRTLGDFCRLLILAGRPVVDKTGIMGLYDFHLVFAQGVTAPVMSAAAGGPPDTTASDVPGAPSIIMALQALGLRLNASKGTREFLVIDRVERPSEN